MKTTTKATKTKKTGYACPDCGKGQLKHAPHNPCVVYCSKCSTEFRSLRLKQRGLTGIVLGMGIQPMEDG